MGVTGDVAGARLDSGPRVGAGEPTGATAAAASKTDVVAPPAGPTSASENDQGNPPAPPPTSEQELYDGMPEPLRRYLMEAVAHGQVWADLVQDQLADVYSRLHAQGLPAPEAVGLVNAVKSLESAARKIQPSIQGGSTFASAIWSMDDLVRFSLQIDPEHYGKSVLEALEAFKALGWSVPAVPGPGETHDDWRNTWAVGNRHHGLLVVMTHATTGQRVEVQFPTPQSWAVGKQTHELYETLRFEEGDPFERVVALGRILDIVRAEGVESHHPAGLEMLGPVKPNGPARIFAKDPKLATDFEAFAVRKFGSVLEALLRVKVSAATAEQIVNTLTVQTTPKVSVPKENSDDGPESPGVAAVGTNPAEGPGHVGEVPGDGPDPWASDGPVPGTAGRPGTGAPGRAGPVRRRAAGAGEVLHLPNRDLAEDGHEAGPGDALGGGRGTGDDAVQRPKRDLDLGSEERERDRAPGGRGPVRAAGASNAGAGGGTGPVEGDDAADPGTPAGDVPQPGGPGAGYVGDVGGPGEVAQPAALTGPLAVGADATAALQYVLDRTEAPLLWEGADGILPGQAFLLADGSSVRINTGPNSWARTDPDRPLQMWTVGSFHLDDGPLTPAASAFLGDLLTALEDPGAGLPGPSSHWLAQRATIDPATHTIEGSGVARPQVEGGPVLVWDAAQGWVDATQAGGLARAVDEGLVPAAVFETSVDDPSAGPVGVGAAGLIDQLRQSEQAEALATSPGTPEHLAAIEARGGRRAELRAAGAGWVTQSAAPALAQFLGQRVQPLRLVNGRVLVELDHGRLAVVSLAYAENDALEGSRPGLQQAGTTADIGQLRNDLAAYPDNEAVVASLTRELQQGAVRHFRVQGVLADQEFVGIRVTEFEVIRPAHDEIGVQRTSVEPHRHTDPGLLTRDAMRRAVAGWTPTSVSDAITNALRWLPFINPLYDRYPRTARMPYSNNCADCTRAAADLMQARDARAAFGDNGARVLDDHTVWGIDPGELNEMWRYAGTVGSWHTWHSHYSVFSPEFTVRANEQISEALTGEPRGTVAMVLVNWADEEGRIDGGHWFNAAVTEDGVEWLDGQSAQHHAWPPPYTSPYYGYSVITRAQDSDTWVDLFEGGSDQAGANDAGAAGRAPYPTGETGARRPLDLSALVAYIERDGRTAAGLAGFNLEVGRLREDGSGATAAALSAQAMAAAVADGLVLRAAGDEDGVHRYRGQVSRAAGALVTPDGVVRVSTAMKGRVEGVDDDHAPDHHPAVRDVLDRLRAASRAGSLPRPVPVGNGHSRCAEVALISDALWAFEGEPHNIEAWPDEGQRRLAALDFVRRSDISVVETYVERYTSGKVHLGFRDFPPCDTCKHLVGPDSFFGTAVVASLERSRTWAVTDWVSSVRRVHDGASENPGPFETGARQHADHLDVVGDSPPRGPPPGDALAVYRSLLENEDASVQAVTSSIAIHAAAHGQVPLTAEEVRQGLRHLLADRHPLVDWAAVHRSLDEGYTGSFDELVDDRVAIAPFAPDPDIAAALVRLVEGTGPIDSDLTLLRHEVVEAQLRAAHPSAPHRTLHELANHQHNWEAEVDDGTDSMPGRPSGPSSSALVRALTADPALAARIANATGDWPEDDARATAPVLDKPEIESGRAQTSSLTVTVTSPSAARVHLHAQWIRRGPGERSVLVLSESPGSPFWWGVPEAVIQAVELVRVAVGAPSAEWAGAAVLGVRSPSGGAPDVAQLGLSLRPEGGAEVTGSARRLPPHEVRAAWAVLGLG